MLKISAGTSISFLSHLEQPEYSAVANWISASKDLPIISGIKSFELYPEDLEHWFLSSFTAIVVREDDYIIGLATLSNSEAALKDDTLEICHLIVHQDYRRLYNGSSMVLQLSSFAKSKYKQCKYIVARVVKTNTIAQEMFHFLKWTEMESNLPNNDNDVIWYQKKIR